MSIDLHIHTTASDGRYSPEEIIVQAQKAGLTHIAITDHDTVDGLLALARQGRLQRSPCLTVIPGIEFSTDLPQHEVHILGYHIDIHQRAFQEQLAILKKDRQLRTRRIIEKLNQLGYDIDYEQVVKIAGQNAALGRAQISKALVEKGYFNTVGEVFERLLQKNGPAYVPHYKLSPDNVIQLIRQVGGKAVLAHPGLVGDDGVVLAMIHAGIDGLEVYHPRHDARDTQKYLEMAQQHGLLITGGSDFHGIAGRFPERLGMMSIPRSLLQGLCQKQI
ncbi:hypothetical protein P22_2257 [Propionispora sp. 2/2-37]|uniref:PHP domain-containing protein n=1 Tax=Propionispora sp. 2/2-37 TaxID=1677858 RepID=UPI0006BB6197|nr:PHP domain-containing protein [Propionispora sp. 2/2-37]CUH96169.1 hypothetical protein P22_2257 [Propionispora sp. 2/2-37]